MKINANYFLSQTSIFILVWSIIVGMCLIERNLLTVALQNELVNETLEIQNSSVQVVNGVFNLLNDDRLMEYIPSEHRAAYVYDMTSIFSQAFNSISGTYGVIYRVTDVGDYEDWLSYPMSRTGTENLQYVLETPLMEQYLDKLTNLSQQQVVKIDFSANYDNEFGQERYIGFISKYNYQGNLPGNIIYILIFRIKNNVMIRMAKDITINTIIFMVIGTLLCIFCMFVLFFIRQHTLDDIGRKLLKRINYQQSAMKGE